MTTPMTDRQLARQILRDVKSLLNTNLKWCKADFARDQYGRRVNPSKAEACRWCLMGAIYRCAGVLTWPEALQSAAILIAEETLVVAAGQSIENYDGITLNDSAVTTFDDLHVWLDEAIAVLARAES